MTGVHHKSEGLSMAYPAFFCTTCTHSYLFNFLLQTSTSVNYPFARKNVLTLMVGSHVDATLVTSLILIKLAVQVIYCYYDIVLTLKLLTSC